MKNRSHNKADWYHGMPADEGSVLSSILEPFRTYNAFKLLNNCFPHYDGTHQTASKWHLKLANFKFTLGELRRTNARFALGCPKWTAHQWKELDETHNTTVVPEKKSSIFVVQTYNTIVINTQRSNSFGLERL